MNHPIQASEHHIMQRILLFLLIALVASCRGGGGDNSAALESGPAQFDANPGLQLSWAESGGSVDVTLTAGQVVDLYQAAAAITYPPDKYTISEIAPGGGLGNPSETFFAGAETRPGRLEFGYTKRFAGPGELGNVALLSFRVTEAGQFRIS
ncbi:MAG TPA: hypothetical protein ENO21_02725, partial [Firmicutes bacterium]|nr:hypothetical protein [Bacillota bacterium]